MVFDSVYEMFKPLTSVRKQHFWEWFSGESLDSKRWGVIKNGNGTAAPTDSIDGGLLLNAPAESNNAIAIGFNADSTNNVNPMAVRPFSHTGSVVIIVAKFDPPTDYTGGDGSWIGFANELNFSAGGNNTLMVGVKGNESTFMLQTTNGSGSQTRRWQSPMVTADTNYHVWKLENFMDGATQKARMYMDGTLIYTSTDTLPAGQMGILASAVGDGSNVAQTHIRYIEAYNT